MESKNNEIHIKIKRVELNVEYDGLKEIKKN